MVKFEKFIFKILFYGSPHTMYYVYVLHSIKDRKLYIGYTADLRSRYTEHCKGLAASTKNRGPLRLVYYEAYLDKLDAKKREVFLKSGSGHRFIKKQLANYFKNNPLAR